MSRMLLYSEYFSLFEKINVQTQRKSSSSSYNKQIDKNKTCSINKTFFLLPFMSWQMKYVRFRELFLFLSLRKKVMSQDSN